MPRPDVVVRYGADMRQHDQALNGMKMQLRSLSSLAGAFGASLSAVGLASFTKQTLAWGDSLAKTADKIGIGTEALQELRFAAERAAGVTTNQLDVAMQRFSRRVGEAAQGQGDLRKVLDQYGVSVRDATGRMRPLEAILNDYADAVRRAGSDQEQLRLAFKAFDSEGAALVNMLRNGSEGLDALRRSARDAGVVLENSMIRTAERINDQWDTMIERMSVRFKGFVITVIDGWREVYERIKYGAPLDESLAITPELAALNAQLSEAKRHLSEIRAGGARPQAIRNAIMEVDKLLSARTAMLESMAGTPRGEGLTITIDKGTEAVKRQTTAVGELKDRWDYLLDIYEQQDRDTQIMWARQQAGIATTTKALGGLKKTVEETQKTTNELDWAFQSAFESAILEGGKLSDVLKGLAKDIAAVFIRQSITAPLANAAGGLFSSIFGGFFAAGGIAPANKLSVVGETGPEFIMPARDTAVVPAGMGGVSVTNNWDFSGANPATVQLLRNEASRIVEASKASVLQAIEQGGGYARSVGRRT